MNNKAGLTLFFPINTMSKLFCSCPNSDAAGISYCPICRDMPGVMPLINKQALNAAIAAGCMLKIHFSASSFERKPIFCGERLIQYTITQENSPIGTNGCIRFDTEDIKINKIYLEQETGIAGGKIDYNKRGRPLLGIETAVCFNDAYQACSFYQQLQARLKKKGLIKEGRTNTGILRFSNGPEITQIELNQLKEAFIWGENAKKARYIWNGSCGQEFSALPGKIFYPNVNLCSIHVDPEWIRRVRMEFGL